MADVKNVAFGKKVFNTVCEYFDEIKWKYTKSEDDLKVTLSVAGDDLLIPMTISLNTDLQIIQLASELQFTVPQDKSVEMSIAVNTINDNIINGYFVFDFCTHTIEFKLNSCYAECIIGKELINYMVRTSCSTIDDYNDKLLFLIKDVIGIEEFLKSFE